mmetsp:Transcript_62666/g.161765  ORF Transcript_62666/g.161765 Transcript_62666/m.161765 type:complete len:658 (+) Transcript_62666:50-2023(+)
MQTPQCTFAAMDMSSLQSLQKLRNTLQEIPRKWLARADSAEDDHLLGTVSGECNYHFTLRVEGGGFFQTGMLVAEARRAGGSSLPVPLKCRWKRKIGDLTVDIPGVSTNMYQISADDVGTTINVEAQPADVDDGLYGAVVGEIGPFELDPSTRRSLDNALGSGGINFTSTQPPKSNADGSMSGGPGQEVHIHVSVDGVKVIVAEASGRSSCREVYVEYSADYPKVIIHPLDTNKFQLIMSESKTFTLLALSRANRDLVALTIRCFHAHKYVSTSSVLAALLPPPTSDPQAGSSSDAKLDALIRLERLLKELNQSMQKKETSERVLRNTRYEKKELQEQLMESISGCSDVIMGLQDEFSTDGPGSPQPAVTAERIAEQLNESQAVERGFRKDVANTKEALEALRATLRKAEEITPQILRSREERNMLRSRLSELTTVSNSAKQLDQDDQSHALELKRLRQDVEALHNCKEKLRKRLQDKETEKEELQQNFFYVKSQLDKCQLRVAQDANGEAAGKELERHSTTLSNTKDERTRLSSRLESVLRDQEKEKVYHEQQVDRVTQANAKLHEDKDRVAREVQRLSQMYADAVKQLQCEGSAGAGQADMFATDPADQVGSSASADPEDVRRVRAALREKQSSLKSKQAENESLRNRIRKLAVD